MRHLADSMGLWSTCSLPILPTSTAGAALIRLRCTLPRPRDTYKWRLSSLRMVQIPTLVTIWEGLRFTGYYHIQSLRDQYSELRGFCLIPAPEWMSATKMAGHHYTQLLGMDSVRLPNWCMRQVSTHGIGN